MQKKFLTSLVILLFLNLLIKPFWILGIDRVVNNIVGAQEYGFYFAIFNFSFLFNILLDVGLTNFNNRNISQNSHLLNKYFSGIVVLKILLSIVYIIITISIGLIIGYNSNQMQLLYVLGFNQILISFILYLRSNISGLHFFKTDSLISVLDRFLMILFCSVLIWGNITNQKMTIQWFVYAQTTAYLLTAAVAFIIVVRKSNFSKLYWNSKFFIVIIRQSLPYALLVLLMTFYNRIDSVMIERLLSGNEGAYQSGIYASAYRLLDATNMIAYLFSVLLLPIFARMIKQKQDVGKMVKLSFSLLITPAIIISFSCIFYRYEIMNMLNPQHTNETIEIFQSRLNQGAFVFAALMGCFIAISTTYIFGTLLTANGNLKQLNIFASIGMLVNIALNFIVIPVYLASGSAVVCIITQFGTAALQMGYAIIKFKFKIRWIIIFRFVFFVIGLLLIQYLFKQFNFEWHYKFILLILASFTYAFVLKLINVKEIIHIFKLTEEKENL